MCRRGMLIQCHDAWFVSTRSPSGTVRVLEAPALRGMQCVILVGLFPILLSMSLPRFPAFLRFPNLQVPKLKQKVARASGDCWIAVSK